jgi:serine/threonine-protein kinase
LPEVARELDVARVVTGRLRADKTGFRLAVELIDVATQTTLWSRSWSRGLPELGATLREAGLDLRGALGVAAGPHVAAAKKPPAAAAYASYLRGRYFWNQRTSAGLTKAIGSFEEAIRADAAYADAYVGIADSYLILPYMSDMTDKEAESHVRPALDKALALDPASSPAHNARAYEHLEYRWAFADSEREFQQALALDPGNPVAHQWYGELLDYLARWDEAIAQMRLALEIDPVSVPVHKNFGMVLLHARRFAEAETVLRRTVEMDTKQPYLHLHLGMTLAEMGRYEESLEELRIEAAGAEAPLLQQGALVTQLYAAARTGRKEIATRLLHQLEGSALMKIQPFLAGYAYALAGRPDKMYPELERAVTERARWTLLVNVSPAFDAYRREERFQALRRRIGFPP